MRFYSDEMCATHLLSCCQFALSGALSGFEKLKKESSCTWK